MKAVFVESYNGYLAKGPEDDMSWTPKLDKQLFKLLSCAFGGVCVCSRQTYELLPNKMKYDDKRRFIIAERTGANSLVSLNKIFPNAILVGGPAFLKAAYDLKVIDTFVVTTINERIVNNPKYENPFMDLLLRLNMLCEIKFGTMTTRVYINEQQY